MNLKDKTIVITGGGQGLGRAMAIHFAEQGAKLALVDLDSERLDETAGLCDRAGGSASTHIANVAKEDEVIALFDAVAERHGAVHGLINNAGITRDGMLLKFKDGKVVKRMSLAEWQAVIDVNLTGVFLCGREAATRMVEGGEPGVIINISSISRDGNMGQTNYSAAKAGVVAMTVTWAKELARFKIRVGAIAPGFTGTEMVRSMKPEALEKMAAQIPLGRIAEPEEIAHTARFIFENDYFTGRVIQPDGGIRL